ncbi:MULTISPECIES: DinB family protein [Priestia]|uniref:DinB family protein n=1 Tax=Priestia TaxID=2800373 RepID=UPI00040AF586|nr:MULTISPECIES: DinB family protein [Priestia]ANF44438.1 hypothetical protein AZK53_01510 [Priestia megaterium]AQU72152.1 hypothetical protein BUW91_01695 [Priestia megaterium]MCU7766076.1 DinB family protein [Priestia megaterium]
MNKNEQFRNDVLSSVESLTYEQLNQQPASNTWSVMQVLEHLYLMERMIVSRVKDQLENGVDQPTEDKPFHLAVDRSRKVDAPAQVTPSNEKQTLEEMKSKLAESRAALIELEETASEDKLKQKSFPHPVFGLMDLKQWIDFIGYHEKRHQEQIEEIKAVIGA